MKCTRRAPTLCGSEPLLLHLKHALDHKRRSHSLHDETDSKGKSGWHAKHLDDQASIKEGFNDARHQKKSGCDPAHPLEDLQAELSQYAQRCGDVARVL